MAPRPKASLMLGVLGLAVAVTLLYNTTVPNIQRTILYAPKKYTREEELAALQKYGLSEDVCVDLVALDKTKLRAYWLPMAEAVGDVPTVLYLHGNTGKIEWGLSSARSWQRHMPVNFLVPSYRGFGRSEGEPDMEGVRRDSQAALDYLLGKTEIDHGKIVLCGHSLGGAVALHLATDNPGRVAAVIVENTFLKIARVIFGNSWLADLIDPAIRENWNNELQVERLRQQAMGGLKVPHVLVLAGGRDRRVPAWHSEGIWRALEGIPGAATSVRRFHQFVDGAHTCHAHPGYHQKIKEFLDNIFSTR